MQETPDLYLSNKTKHSSSQPHGTNISYLHIVNFVTGHGIHTFWFLIVTSVRFSFMGWGIPAECLNGSLLTRLFIT
jgi:hypothetical protein